MNLSLKTFTAGSNNEPVVLLSFVFSEIHPLAKWVDKTWESLTITLIAADVDDPAAVSAKASPVYFV